MPEEQFKKQYDGIQKMLIKFLEKENNPMMAIGMVIGWMQGDPEAVWTGSQIAAIFSMFIDTWGSFYGAGRNPAS